MALGRLLANPRRGYGIDPETGNLFWWKGRTAKHEGDTGSVHTAQIVSIRVDLREDCQGLSLYGEDGERLAYFDEELVPWPHDRWAEQFKHAYPDVRIDKLV